MAIKHVKKVHNQRFTFMDAILLLLLTGWNLPVTVVPAGYGTITATPVYTSEKYFGLFKVDNEYFDDFTSAVNYAAGTKVIYLNADAFLEEAIELGGVSATLNLNGKNVTVADSVTTVFDVQSGAKFTITGDGAFNNVSNLVTASGAATVNLDATGSGVVVNHKAVENDTTIINTFRMHDRSVLNVSGFVTVNAYNGKKPFHRFSLNYLKVLHFLNYDTCKKCYLQEFPL